MTGAENPQPGQFLTIRVSDGPSPLLRRPFAYSHVDPADKTAGVIYKVRGAATRALSGKLPGDDLDIIGTLGNSFVDPPNGSKAILLAGGIGLGPMLLFARTLRNSGKDYEFVYGCRSEEEIPDLDDLDTIDYRICTDDGSRGFRGTAVDLASASHGPAVLYACGPTAMLKACHDLAVDRKWACWVSLEQTMGCAMGACMGCVVKTVTPAGFARVCQEGPVFESRVIEWT